MRSEVRVLLDAPLNIKGYNMSEDIVKDLVEELPLHLVKATMKRLYSEDRMSADEMRDHANGLWLFVQQVEDLAK